MKKYFIHLHNKTQEDRKKFNAPGRIIDDKNLGSSASAHALLVLLLNLRINSEVQNDLYGDLNAIIATNIKEQFYTDFGLDFLNQVAEEIIKINIILLTKNSIQYFFRIYSIKGIDYICSLLDLFWKL